MNRTMKQGLQAMGLGRYTKKATVPKEMIVDKETAVDKALRVAREKLDVAEKKFHDDAKTPLRKAKAALTEAEAHYRKAWLTHEKATKAT